MIKVEESTSMMIEGITPIVCIFCKFTTCVEFDMDLHLYQLHRIELLKLSIGKGSFDFRIKYAIDEGRRVGVSAAATATAPKQEPTQVQALVRAEPGTGVSPTSFNPIMAVKTFFNISTLPLPNHTLERSPCYPLIMTKAIGKYILYSCKLHPRIESIHLGSLEHHIRYTKGDAHESEIIAWMSQQRTSSREDKKTSEVQVYA